jgi:uncharacterized membrane protein (DUF373 family)
MKAETRGVDMPFKEKIISTIEVTVVTALEVLLIVVVAVATIVLYLLFVRNVLPQVSRVESAAGLLPTMQNSFAGVLVVVLGLELLETLKTYFSEHHIRVEVILVVAIIAVARHLIQVDFEHTPGTVLLGLSAVILALTVGYFITKKAHVTDDSR